MADVRWAPQAVAVAQVGSFTVSGTWATSDTATLTINSKDVTITLGATVTIEHVVDSLVAAVNGTAAAGDETQNSLGTDYAEWSNITASKSGTTQVVLTADVAGVPFTATASEVTAGSGAIGSYSATTAATGPNDWSNGENWTGGSAPSNSDDVYIQNSSVDILYGLGQSSVTLTSLYIDLSYTGRIGLPLLNTTGTDYAEYLEDYLSISATTVVIGRGTGSGPSRLKLDTGSNATNITVLSSPTAMQWKGSHASNVLTVESGTVEVAPYAGEAAQTATLNQSGGTVRCYDGCTLAAVNVDGGTLTLEDNTTTTTISNGTLNINGSATVTTLNINGGTVNYGSSGTITTLNCRKTFNAEANTAGRTITNCNLYPDGVIKDRHNTLTLTNNVALGTPYKQIKVS